MRKQIVIRFDKSDGVWETVVGIADEKERAEAAGVVIAGIGVKNYELTDHQFIQATLNVHKGKELMVLIPRSIVVTIIESKSGLGKVGFVLSGGS